MNAWAVLKNRSDHSSSSSEVPTDISRICYFRAANAWIDALGFKKCLIKGREFKTLSTVFLGGNVTTVVHESD